MTPEARSYLVEQLRRDPTADGAEIIHARDAFLGHQRRKVPGDQEVWAQRERREHTSGQLERLRKHFWSADLNLLRSELAQLQTAEFPDLDAAARRLRVVAAQRDRFPQLSQHPHFDGQFFEVLKHVLVSSPRDAADWKERAFAAIRTPQIARRVKRMKHLLASQVPDVYQLEADWFSTLARSRSADEILPSAMDTESSTAGVIRVVFWILSLFVILLLFRWLR